MLSTWLRYHISGVNEESNWTSKQWAGKSRRTLVFAHIEKSSYLFGKDSTRTPRVLVATTFRLLRRWRLTNYGCIMKNWAEHIAITVCHNLGLYSLAKVSHQEGSLFHWPEHHGQFGISQLADWAKLHSVSYY